MVNKPLIRPYFLGGVALGGVGWPAMKIHISQTDPWLDFQPSKLQLLGVSHFLLHAYKVLRKKHVIFGGFLGSNLN